MAISEHEVARIAELARLELDADERARLARELSAILEHVETIRELDLGEVPPTSHGGEAGTPLRPDRVEPSRLREALLAAAPDQADGHFRVPRVV